MANKCIFRHEFDKNCSKSQFHERKKIIQFFFCLHKNPIQTAYLRFKIICLNDQVFQSQINKNAVILTT